MKFKNKAELIQFVKRQTNIELLNEANILNNKRNLLYTEICRNNKNTVLSLLNKYGIRFEYHVGNSYFIFVK